jgi:transcriptional regulator GlxA family with amidase domain
MLPDTIITDHNGIYTSGGAFSSLNLILYLIEKFCGREISLQLSKEFSIDMDRITQSHFAVFQGQRNHNDTQVLKAQTFIEKKYNQEISVEQIAAHANMSKRNFIRRFKNATNNNPLEYLQRVRIESGKRLMESGERNILSIMHNAGYNDIKTFRTIFKRITGLTPQEYLKKYMPLNFNKG